MQEVAHCIKSHKKSTFLFWDNSVYIFNAVEQIQRTTAQIQELETSIHSYCTFTLLLTPTKEMDTISIKYSEYGSYFFHEEDWVF